MAFSNITDQQLGKFLQIAFSDGVRTQISTDFRDYEMVKRARVADPNGRELRFFFMTAFGPAAIQYRNPNFTAAFPEGHEITTSENSAVFKELDATVQLEYNLWNRARKSPAKYAEPLAMEIQAKTFAAKRRLAADLYGDGTGVVGQLATSGGVQAAVTSPASDKLTFNISSADTARGHVGFFEYGDILVLKAAAGSASAINTNLSTEPAYWKVVTKDRKNGQVTLQGLDSSLNSAGTISSFTTQPAAGEVFYRYGQPTIPDLTATISDYGSITEVIPGLESLVAYDGRVIHGITMSGATGGSQYDAGGVAIDTSTLQAALDAVKINVGQSSYKWPMMVMAPETHAAFIESRETDRRFTTVEDNKRGVKYFAFVHGNDTLETVTSEYCPLKRIYCAPDGKIDGHKVLEAHLTDFEAVKVNDSSQFNLKPSSSGGFERRIVTYMEAMGTLICNHPAAVAVVRNFTT
jgi:hypothetical protein